MAGSVSHPNVNIHPERDTQEKKHIVQVKKKLESVHIHPIFFFHLGGWDISINDNVVNTCTLASGYDNSESVCALYDCELNYSHRVEDSVNNSADVRISFTNDNALTFGSDCDCDMNNGVTEFLFLIYVRERFKIMYTNSKRCRYTMVT